MAIIFDHTKNEQNVEKRGISFIRAEEFDFTTAFYEVDKRKDYGENRIKALGFIGDRLHSLVFTERGDDIRVISLRKANQRERKKYEKEAKS